MFTIQTIQKRCSMFILLFCALFLSQNLFAITEQYLFERLSQENISANEVNQLLEIIVTQNEKTEFDSIPLDLPKQEELINLALKKGGKFSDIKLERGKLPSYAAANLMLNNKYNTIDSSMFLNFVSTACSCEKRNSTMSKLEVDYDLQEKQLTLIKLALANKADPNEILKGYFHGFLSVKASEFLLNNKLINPDGFLVYVLRPSTTKFNIETSELEIDIEYQDRQFCMVKLALANKANPNKIERFSSLPSIELSELLFINGLEAQRFLDLVLSVFPKSFSPKYVASFLSEQKALVEIAIKRGAALFQSYKTYHALKYAHDNNLFIGFHQVILMNRIPLFWKKFKIDTNKELNEKSEGYCMGLTTLWLYTMWLEAEKPQNTYKYNKPWFEKTMSTIVAWDGEKDISEYFSDIQKFGSLFSLFQAPNNYISGISQQDVDKVMNEKSGLETYGNLMIKKYTIASSFTLEQLSYVLEKTVHNHELVYVIHPGHATGLFKDKESYYFYDPDNNRGERVCATAKEAADAIFAVSKDLNNKRYIGLIIYRFEKEGSLYEKPKNQVEILTEIHQAFIDEKDLVGGGSIAANIGCTESLEFFVKQGLDLNKHGATLLRAGSLNPKIVSKLLKSGVNPNQVIETYTEMGNPIKTHLLHMASEDGHVDIVKALLGDSRIEIDKKDSAGKTAFDYATEKGHVEIKELLAKYKQ